MNLAALVRAVDVLRSPHEWGSREAWLDESLRRVRDVCDTDRKDVPVDAVGELEALLHLPNDPPGWLHLALDSPSTAHRGIQLPAIVDAPETILLVLSLRCALLAGLAALDWTSPGLPTTQELRIGFGLRGREPQVALLVAEGLTNAAIAERLRLSAHTVRHYLERVLDRLGLHSRKALALHLMAGGGERAGRRAPGRSTP